MNFVGLLAVLAAHVLRIESLAALCCQPSFSHCLAAQGRSHAHTSRMLLLYSLRFTCVREGVTHRRGNGVASGEQLPFPLFSHTPAALSSTSNQPGIDAHTHTRTRDLRMLRRIVPYRPCPVLLILFHFFSPTYSVCVRALPRRTRRQIERRTSRWQ